MGVGGFPDIHMPVLDGVELTRRVRQGWDAEALPVIGSYTPSTTCFCSLSTVVNRRHCVLLCFHSLNSLSSFGPFLMLNSKMGHGVLALLIFFSFPKPKKTGGVRPHKEEKCCVVEKVKVVGRGMW